MRSKENIDIVLSDFGLAQCTNIKPDESYLFPKCGTPGYVAPEIINLSNTEDIKNIRYDEKCDIFSAGVIFYLCLILDLPFSGESATKVIKKNKKAKINFESPKFLKLT